ncbi:MAG: hypothetical protein ACYCRE_07205 [Acidobacteriaceae bacterium]
MFNERAKKDECAKKDVRHSERSEESMHFACRSFGLSGDEKPGASSTPPRRIHLKSSLSTIPRAATNPPNRSQIPPHERIALYATVKQL